VTALSPPLRVLVVGQTPPPHGGQATAIASLLGGDYDGLVLTHVRMAFSADMAVIGKLRLGKLTHLIGLVFRIWVARIRHRPQVLYYPPAGPDLLPVMRDLVVLLATRWCFRRTVFHFHAAGLSELAPRLPRVLQPLLRRAYGRPDLALVPSALNPPDGAFVGARRTVVVPNGVADPTELLAPNDRSRRVEGTGAPTLLYLGVLRESKGVLVLLDAVRLLRRHVPDVRLRLVGTVESPQFADELRRRLNAYDLHDVVEWCGPLTGRDKSLAFRDSDVFCYPSHFESETFGLVLIEAMACSLPVVATRWRGIPDAVAEGETALLVPPQDAAAFADAVITLLDDPTLAHRLGAAGRSRYDAHFTEARFRRRMEESLCSLRSEVAGSDRPPASPPVRTSSG
jgi:glycosyltransferase involved in cell wall biosynthesis